MGLVEKYHDRHLADRLIDLAWTHGQIILQQLNATEAEAQLYGRLASSIIYASGLDVLTRHFGEESPRSIRSVGPWHFRGLADRSAANR